MRAMIWLAVWAASLVLAFFVGRGQESPSPELLSPAPADMAAAARAALGEGSPLARMGQSAQMLEHLDAQNLEPVLDVYEMMLSGLGECDLRLFVDAWSDFDPRGAFDHTMSWEYSNKRVVGSDAAIRGWAIRNPIEARAAVPEIVSENPRIQGRIIDNFLVGWAHSGQPGLDEYVADIQTPAPEKYVAQVLHATLRKGGPEAVFAWSDGVLQNPDYSYGLKRAAFRTGLRTSARWEPESASVWVAPYLGEEWADDGPRIMGDQWGKQDGRAAMEWVSQLPESETRESAVRAAFASWMKNDRADAEAWILSQSLSPFHDPALTFYARDLAETDPVRALDLCGQIHGTKRRTGCMKKAAKNWYKVDALAAEEWLQESELDEEVRAQVRRPDQLAEPREGAGTQRAKRLGGPPSRRR